MNIVYIALGSNLGNRKEYLDRAVDEIKKRIGEVVSLSAFYETEPWGFVSEYPFLNAVLRADTQMDVFSALDVTQEIECDLGRLTKSSGAYQDRCIDIDLLFFNNEVLTTERLVLPHPLLHERSFVLEPLAEIAPDLYHPVLRQNIGNVWHTFQIEKNIHR